MTFVDTDMVMAAADRLHSQHPQARALFDECQRNGTRLCTSAEVLQELAHIYLRVNMKDVFDEAMALLASYDVTIWPLEDNDVILAAALQEQHPTLPDRYLCYLACCQRRGVTRMMTFDAGLAAAAAATLR